jgi:hypothetical protein
MRKYYANDFTKTIWHSFSDPDGDLRKASTERQLKWNDDRAAIKSQADIEKSATDTPPLGLREESKGQKISNDNDGPKNGNDDGSVQINTM